MKFDKILPTIQTLFIKVFLAPPYVTIVYLVNSMVPKVYFTFTALYHKLKGDLYSIKLTLKKVELTSKTCTS